MKSMTSNPNKFAALFNEKLPGAHRKITAEDVIYMTRCKLICRYNFYLRDDLETVRGILEYEQLREKGSIQKYIQDRQEPPKCKRCGQTLPTEPEGKIGRPKEYCHKCESLRNNERQKKSRRQHNTVNQQSHN